MNFKKLQKSLIAVVLFLTIGCSNVGVSDIKTNKAKSADAEEKLETQKEKTRHWDIER